MLEYLWKNSFDQKNYNKLRATLNLKKKKKMDLLYVASKKQFIIQQYLVNADG